ncbi:hypothetical protein EDB84DRAFT_1433699 [Lactarius hengduanensis]|nr:hypothetical protein EDB84DRAFT_1433699 [Lactarius hengduanensis]
MSGPVGSGCKPVLATAGTATGWSFSGHCTTGNRDRDRPVLSVVRPVVVSWNWFQLAWTAADRERHGTRMRGWVRRGTPYMAVCCVICVTCVVVVVVAVVVVAVAVVVVVVRGPLVFTSLSISICTGCLTPVVPPGAWWRHLVQPINFLQNDDQQAGKLRKSYKSNHNYLSHIMVSTTVVSQGAASDKVVTWCPDLPCCGAVVLGQVRCPGSYVVGRRGGGVGRGWRMRVQAVLLATAVVRCCVLCWGALVFVSVAPGFWCGMGRGGRGGAWVVTRHRETRTVGVTVWRDGEMAWSGWR